MRVGVHKASYDYFSQWRVITNNAPFDVTFYVVSAPPILELVTKTTLVVPNHKKVVCEQPMNEQGTRCL
jgi:hypothetical protein